MTKAEKAALRGLYEASWMRFEKTKEAYAGNRDSSRSGALLLKMECARSRWAGIDDVLNELTGGEE